MRTVSLTSKNQLTLPVALLREHALKPGTKFAARWVAGSLVLEPIQALDKVLAEAQAHLAPLVAENRRSPDVIEASMRDWPMERGARYGTPD